MKRLAALALAIIVPVAVLLVSGVVNAPPAQSTPREVVLEAYLRGGRSTSDAVPAAEKWVPASRPGNFTAQMSGMIFRSGGSASDGGPPLSLPPVQLWCVYVNREGNSGPAIVFVAEQAKSYWGSEWVVHEPAGDVQAILSAVGCQ